MIVEAVAIVILVILSAFFSLSETALTTISRLKIKRFYEEKLRGAKALFELREDAHHMLATILIANNVVNITASALTTLLTLQSLSMVGLHRMALAVGVATGIITLLILLFGEITPKSIAIQNADRIALWVAPPIKFLSFLLYPLIELLIYFSQFFVRILGGKNQERSPFLTVDELKTMVTVGKEEGVLEAQEEHMIHSIMEFGDKKVTEVMTPRTEMICLKSTESIQEAIQVIAKEGHSRIPLYEGNIDNIIGVVYAKDLLKVKEERDLTLKECMRTALFIPEGKRIDELLFQMQSAKTHIAIIVDEYGGTVGLVTFEDIIEEIVGEIQDEYDVDSQEEGQAIKYEGTDTVILPAKMGVDEVNELLHMDLPKEEYDTIGGFVFGLFGRLPARGETITHLNLHIQIEEVRRRQIKKIRITRLKEKIGADHGD